LQTSPKRATTTAWDLRRLVGSVNQLRFNDRAGEVSFFGQKMVIMRRDVFRVMREGLERLVGDQAAPFLSFLASGIGIHEGSIFRDSVQASNEREKRISLENLVHTALEDTNLGLGKLKVDGLDFDKGGAKVTITNCFEALENGQSEQPNCMFTSGFLAGVFAEVLDKTVQAVEVKCISQGQPECEFQIGPAPETSGEGVSPSEESGESGANAEQDSGLSASGAGTITSATSNAGTAGTADTGQTELDSGVERASRIAKRKKGFWDRMFNKEE
jgi:predicted hydrocarbon binding protein